MAEAIIEKLKSLKRGTVEVLSEEELAEKLSVFILFKER